MNRDSGNAPRSKRHQSRTGSTKKQSSRQKAFQNDSGSSSISSYGKSTGQSENEKYLRKPVKKANSENKDALVKALQSKVKELRHKLKVLEECAESKDYSLGTLTRDKDRALGEVRRLERSNKQLRRQLNEERTHYMEEKEKFCEEMTRYKKRVHELKMTSGSSASSRPRFVFTDKPSTGMFQKGDSSDIDKLKIYKDQKSNLLTSTGDFRKANSLGSFSLYEGQDLTLQMAALRTENAKLRATLNEFDERNYELCVRFLRMKQSKIDLRNRFQDLENEYLQVITNLMEKIDEAREEFNFIIDEKFKAPLHTTNAKYLKTVRRNSKIALENVTLRMELQNLKKEMFKLKGNGDVDQGRKTTEDDPKLSPNEGKLKLPKSFNTMRTRPYAEESAARASDTDSNYMSKTSTTDPSMGSIADAKSNESIFVDPDFPGAVNHRHQRNPLFSDEILNKIFKRVDSASSFNSPRDLENRHSRSNTGEKKSRKGKHVSETKSNLDLEEDTQVHVDEKAGKRYILCSLNSKKFHEITTNCVTKKIDRQNNALDPNREKPIESKTDRQHTTRRIRPQCKESKDRIRKYPDSVKDGQRMKRWRDRGDNPDEDELILPQFHSPRRQRRGRQSSHMRDSCGLEEKLDTDLELPPDYAYDNQASFRSKADRIMDQLVMITDRSPDWVKDRIRDKSWQETELKDGVDANSDDDSAIEASSVRGRNRNNVSLHDELMEATKTLSQTDDPFWRRELNLHSLITKKSASSSRTYRLAEWKSKFHTEARETARKQDRKLGSVTQVEVQVLRKDPVEYDDAASLNGNITSRAGSQQDSPCSVSMRTTGTSPMVPAETSSEVILRFLMLPTTIQSNRSLLFDDTDKGSSLAKVQGSQGVIERSQVSALILPKTSMPSSNSTMDLVESSRIRENELTSRTLSAPALLESEWLNSFQMCEMKDCSTNT